MKKLIVRVMIALVAIAALLPIRAFAGEDLKFQLSVDGTGAVTLVSSKAGGGWGFLHPVQPFRKQWECGGCRI